MNANIPWRPSYDALARFAAEQARRLEALAPRAFKNEPSPELIAMTAERDALRQRLEAAHEKLAAYSNLWGEMYARRHG